MKVKINLTKPQLSAHDLRGNLAALSTGMASSLGKHHPHPSGTQPDGKRAVPAADSHLVRHSEFRELCSGASCSHLWFSHTRWHGGEFRKFLTWIAPLFFFLFLFLFFLDFY